ncbi:ABC transporter substrate-binding protein [Kutzneria sp. CA-103260]|nr:ABC transporter substrate-binding protein [Kutzneria sp. CA-103260]QUQ64857.1 ABC transporter substrate-binding protein [Kutzneria sp. CA-103260]
MKRLTILLVAVLMAGCLTGCGPATTELTVLGPWTGAEEQSFRAMFHDFETADHVTINYTGTPAVNQVLRADVQKGQPPDVAILSSPGELARYAAAGQLRTVSGLDATAYSGQWRTLLKLGSQNNTYAVPVKADLKSIVWFNAKTSPGLRLSNWSELLDYTAKGAPNTWCLGMEAYSTSGWPGTDWIEDILLHQSGRAAYDLWADGGLSWKSSEVEAAWRAWGQLLAAQGQQSVRSAALLTYFGDAGKQMFATQNRCLLEHQGSFAPGSYPPSASYDFFPFPSLNPAVGPRTFEVSVNLAGLFTDNPLARDFMTYLAGGPAQAVWPAQQGSRAYSVNRTVLDAGVYKDAVSKAIGSALTTADVLCLDASDVMPAEMADAFSRAVLEYLGDPSRLDTILDGLENVRLGLADPPTLSACG